jgi:hypothetical protein
MTMQRGTIIATVVAAGGVLIAGSVASVAVINAASSAPAQSQTVQLVDDAAVQASPTASTPPSTQPSAVALEPVAQPSDLPALPSTPTDESPSADATQAAAQPSKSAAPKPPQAPAATVSAVKAARIVLQKGDGQATISVQKDTRQGYRTWAVQIQRSNGEVLTGFVDRESGVVVDWRLDRAATPAQPSTQASNGQSDDSGDDNSGHGSNDNGSNSGSDNHGGSDDSDD